MAKLEGVKVLDMVNGEILRVEYGGEIYEKVDGPAQANDLIYATTNTLVDVTKNSFYKCIGVDSDGCVVFYDDADDFMTRQPRSFQVFRKISAQPSLADRVTAVETKLNDLSSRVDKLEGKTDDGYRLVTDREPRVGDYVKYARVEVDHLTAGKYYEIVDFDEGDPVIIDDDDDLYDTCDDKFEVYEKVTEKFNACKAKDRPTVGDFVRVSKHCPYNNLAGKYLKIINDDMSDIPYTAEYLDGNCAGWLLEEDVEKVTDENVLKFLRIGRKPDEFKVGDLVLFKGTDGSPHGLEGYEGIITEVTDVDKGVLPIRLSVPSFIETNWSAWTKRCDVELIVPVEARVDRP